MVKASRVVSQQLRNWQRYEADPDKVTAYAAAKMPAAVWELYLLDCLHSGAALPKPFAGYIRDRWPEFYNKKTRQ